MLCSDVSYQLLNKHCLTDSGASEETDLTTLCIRSQKVDDLDSCLEDLYDRALVLK